MTDIPDEICALMELEAENDPAAVAAACAAADADADADATDVAASAVIHDRFDHLELAMLASGEPMRDFTVSHVFTPGLYVRTILMPAGSLLTSRIHKTRHPFVVLAGRAEVYIPGVGTQMIEAPYFGVTEPGTRRLLYIHEDCVWATFHPIVSDEDDEPNEARRLEMIEERIIERRELADGKTTHQLYSELLNEAKQAGLVVDVTACIPENIDG